MPALQISPAPPAIINLEGDHGVYAVAQGPSRRSKPAARFSTAVSKKPAFIPRKGMRTNPARKEPRIAPTVLKA